MDRPELNARRISGIVVWSNILLLVAVPMILFSNFHEPSLLPFLGRALLVDSLLTALVVAVAVKLDATLSPQSKMSLAVSLVLLLNVAAIVIHFAVLNRKPHISP